MIEWRFLKDKERKELEKSLNIGFGIKKIPGEVISAGGERLFFFDGEADEEGLRLLQECAPVERMGVYFAKIIAGEVRLTIEGTQIFQDQIKKNVFELNKEQAEKWMMGEELNIKTGMKGFVIMKFEDNFLGCGKASEEKIGNFIPKTRRLKNKNN